MDVRCKTGVNMKTTTAQLIVQCIAAKTNMPAQEDVMRKDVKCLAYVFPSILTAQLSALYLVAPMNFTAQLPIPKDVTSQDFV